MASILSDSPNAAYLLVLLLETTIGVVLNVIVIGIILKGEKIMKTRNIIGISLSTSNVVFSITVFASVFCGILGPGNVQITDSISAYIVYSLNLFTMSSSSWLTAILSLFYFIKIVDVRFRAIVWTKKNINEAVPWMIMAVEVVALFSSFLLMLLYLPPHQSSMNNSMIHINNSSSHNTDMGLLSIVITVSCLPSFIIVVTTICVAITLKKHSSNMKKNTFNDKQSEAFGKTVSKITRLLVTYSFYYIVVILLYFAAAAHLSDLFWVFLLLLSSFTTVQSVLLVIRNPKSKETAKEMLRCSVCTQYLHS